MKTWLFLCSTVLLVGCSVGEVGIGGIPPNDVPAKGADADVCRCGSTDPSAPCQGNAIETVVAASRRDSGAHYYRDAWFRWEFNSGGGTAFCGEFANGDIWVAPKPGESVQITRVATNGRVSVDDNPVMESTGLLTGANKYGNYVAANDLMRTGGLPVSYSLTTSLVAAKVRNEGTYGPCGTASIVGECVDAYDVVTVLDSVPTNLGADMIRPNVTGATKTTLRWSDFDLSRLPQSTLVKGTNAAGLETIRQRWSHSIEVFGVGSYVDGQVKVYSEGGRAFRAHILHHDYGSGMAQSYNNDLITVFSGDNTVAEKQKALAAMLAFGLDIYHARYDAPTGVVRGWASGAGQHNGKILPAVFLAALLSDSTYANQLHAVNGATHAANIYDRGPAELRQIHPGINGGVWGDDLDNVSADKVEYSYWDAALKSQCFDGASRTCQAFAFGSKTQKDPYGYIDGPANLPGEAYMLITLGVQRAVVASMFMMPEVCAVLDSHELVDYVDRLDKTGKKTAPDVCAAPDSREDPTACDAYRNVGCTYFKVTWGPDPANPGQCIAPSVANPHYRFVSVNGVKVTPAYASSQVEANWTEIRGANAYCN